MDDDDFVQLTRDLQDAVVEQNETALEDLLAPEFRLVTSRPGNPSTREEWIAAAVGPFRVKSYAINDVHIIRAGEAAIVIHRLAQEARLGDREAARDWLTTDVWTRVGGRWQLTARHTEALPE